VDVGSYRRDTDPANTFQIILQDQGNGDFDIIFRYEDIGWTTGTADGDTGARAGLYSPLLPKAITLTNGDLADLDIITGNAGTGVWK
ncbi:nidogen-like domain-containing protein, partial [Serratia sp. 21NM0010]